MLKFKRVKTCLLLFFSLLMLPVLAQEAVVKGITKDDKSILPFVNITVEGTSVGVSSNEKGEYSFNLNPGQYTLHATAVGHKPFRRKITLTPSEVKTVNITLLPSEENLGEVVVTGTMKPTFTANSPVKIDVVTSKKLETFLPTAASSIIESVQLINGVQEVVACGVCFTNSISINGLPGAYTAVLIDGTPIYGSLASVYGLNGIPNMIVDRFEVIKGPNSTLYGSEAVAGVINIITKNPQVQPLLSVDVMGTSHMESFGNLAIAPKLGKTAGFIGYNYAYINNFDDENEDGFSDVINLDRHSVFTKWDIHRNSGKQFTLGGKYYYEDRRNGVEAFLTDRAYRELRGNDSIYGESIYTNRGELFGTYAFNTDNPLKLDFSLSDHQQNSYYGSDFYKASQQIAFGNLIYNLVGEKHDWVLGATLRYQRYDDNTVATPQGADNQFIPGVFVQDEWTLSQSFTLLAGTRLDHYQNHGFIASPRLSTKIKPSQWTTIRTNFGTGFRIVNLFTEDHAFVTGQREVVLAEELKPERSYNFSLGLSHVFNVLGGSGSFDVDGFYTYFTNKIIPDYETEGKIIYANTDGFAQTLGIGANINYNFQFPLSFTIGANILNTTETEPDENGRNQTRNVEFAPKWTGLLNANYTWKQQNLTLAYSLNITGPMQLPEVFDLDANGQPLPNPRPTTSEPFAFQNIQVTKTVNKQLSLYGGLQNLFNYRQQFSPLVGANDPNFNTGFSPFFDTSYAYSPIHGREFYLGVKWVLN